MTQLHRFSTLLFLLVAAVSSADPLPDAVEAPKFVVGDAWRFGRTDLWKTERTEGWGLVVWSIGDDRVVFAGKTHPGKTATGEPKPESTFRMFYTLDGNLIATATRSFSPFIPMLKFPLSVGKTWNGEYRFKHADGTTGDVTLTVKVLAAEKVTVPAGTFDAFKISYDGRYRRHEGSGQMSSTYWYAPAAKTIVRQQYQDTNFSGQLYNQWIMELEGYRLATESGKSASQ